MNKYTKSRIFNDDLFHEWEQELVLRQQLRAAGNTGSLSSINSEEELELLWRALYFSDHRDDFWSAIMEHLHLSLVLNWLSSDDDRLDEFLAYLPAYFGKNKPETKHLQHLVRLFTERFQDRFRAIAAFLDAEDCSYLVSRSANPQFRELFLQRLRFLQERRNIFFYGLEEQIAHTSVPSFHGDKIKMLASGLELMQIDVENQEYHLDLKLEIADTFFRAGMIADSLVLLIEAVNLRPKGLNTAAMVENKQLAKILRKAAASYSLIYQSDSAGFVYKQIHRDYFPFMEPDLDTLRYFGIYELLRISHNSDSLFPLYQIAYEAEIIGSDRNNEYSIISKYDLDNGLSAQRIRELKTLVEQKLVSLPHEAFITMQVMCLLMKKGLADPRSLASFLLENSLALFDWVPSRLFVDLTLLQDHGTIIEDRLREESERIIAAGETFKHSMGSKQESYLDGLKNRDMARLQYIISGYFLGVF